MSVKFSGTQALIAGKQPLAVYEHCLMHCGNLVAQSILKSSAPIRDAISTANDADVFSRQSTKLSNVLKEVKKQHVCSALLRPLCPTWVLCRGSALKCILNNFDCILEALQEYTDSAPADSATKAQGFANVTGHGNFRLSLKCASAVLELLENLNRAVQSSSKSTASVITAMKMTVGALNDLRCEDTYQALFKEVVKLCRETDDQFQNCHVRDARPDDSENPDIWNSQNFIRYVIWRCHTLLYIRPTSLDIWSWPSNTLSFFRVSLASAALWTLQPESTLYCSAEVSRQNVLQVRQLQTFKAWL